MFYAELIGGVLLFSFFMKRKPRFALRLAGSVAATCGLSLLIVWLGYMLYERADIGDVGTVLGLGAVATVYLVLMLSASIGILRFCFFLILCPRCFAACADTPYSISFTG